MDQTNEEADSSAEQLSEITNQTDESAPQSLASPESQSSQEKTPSANQTGLLSKLRLKTYQLLIIAGVLVLFAGAGVWFFIIRDNTNSDSASQNLETSNGSEIATTEEQNALLTEEGDPLTFTPVPRPNYAALTGATWYGELRPIDYQPVFTDEGLRQMYGTVSETQQSYRSSVKFFEVGSYASKPIFVAIPDSYSPGDPDILYFTKDGDSYTLYEGNSSYSYYESAEITYYGIELAPSVTINKTDAFSDIVLQDAISFDGLSLERVSTYQYLSSGNEILSQLTKLGENGYGVIYKRISSSSDWVNMFQLYLKQSSGLYVGYRFVLNTQATSYINDDNSIPISWNDGSSTTDSYQWALVRYGCGMFASVNVLPDAFKPDLVAAGTTKDKTVFVFKNSDSAAFSQIYESYNPSDWPIEGRESKQQVFDNKGVVVIENALGQYVILAKSQYQSAGECAKPVVYLYPELPTYISVKVGADVRISEPEYNDGWKGIAFPNGKILVGSSLYDSLFWEGQGQGTYPEIGNKGFLVKQQDIEQTLRSQLQQLGLNQKESDDFMEFWLPLMPDTPYIRLTWLGTEDMNRLAPLTLSKKPDTLIRIFLDFEGLNSPKPLVRQNLSHPERTGFTVVEWGGLRI